MLVIEVPRLSGGSERAHGIVAMLGDVSGRDVVACHRLLTASPDFADTLVEELTDAGATIMLVDADPEFTDMIDSARYRPHSPPGPRLVVPQLTGGHARAVALTAGLGDLKGQRVQVDCHRLLAGTQAFADTLVAEIAKRGGRIDLLRADREFAQMITGAGERVGGSVVAGVRRFADAPARPDAS